MSEAFAVASPSSFEMELRKDVEAQEPLVVRPRDQNPLRVRCNVALLSCMGAVLVLLIVMAAVFTGSRGGYGSRGSPAPAAPDFAVPSGALLGCTDSEALCLVTKPQPSPEADFRGHPRKVSGSWGLVASDQSRCADIGARVLEDGGHAVDAAVAGSLCQGVVNPFASGVGGGHFALIRSANGTAEFINAREVAPGAARADMYSGKSPYASLDGGLAIAVPLELKGLELAWRRHGRLPWARLVSPAAEIARHGFAAHPYFVYVVTGEFTLKRLKSDPLTAEAFLIREPRTGSYRPPRVGELCCRRPALAATLDAVAKYGVSWLYEPERLRTMAAEIQEAGGILTAEDFQAAEPRVETPLAYTLPGPVPYTLLVPPPPSSGAVLFLALSIVLGYNSSLDQMGPALGAHRQVEAMKHAFAVRNALGDPGTPAMPYTDVAAVLADIANASFAQQLRSLINDSAVLPHSMYGGRWNPTISGVSPEDHGTSHLAVLDKDGNAVSLTTTVNTAFGSNVMSKSTGILFNNEMDDFSRPDTSNKYSLPPAAANSIQPFKRPLSSMAPALVLDPSGALRLVVGASNGPRIISGIMQTILRVLYGGLDPLVAVSGSRLHHQWQPDRCLYEDFKLNGVTFKPDPEVIAGLTARGNNMTSYDDQLGDVQAILVAPGNNTAGAVATAVADPRKDGAPAAATR
ncbi:hypothetical protein PLESTB_000519700 [Pleodorina starrii]|uniref:Glutathione hydrolase n=1 Tax=Pleodorina starrii TaxID=330485 RepID=A0A9W6F0A0_9CHLO|nr:hypothetical protein PLESTB_000519700 [Pleodorina starrii]GLC72366.1 hypothetical protein PLESTF_001240000 [Pleodorina starrii]